MGNPEEENDGTGGSGGETGGSGGGTVGSGGGGGVGPKVVSKTDPERQAKFDSLIRKFNSSRDEVAAILKSGRSASKDSTQIYYFKGCMKAMEKYYSAFENIYDQLVDMNTKVFPTEEDKKKKIQTRNFYYEAHSILEKIIADENKSARRDSTVVLGNASSSEFYSSRSLPKIDLPKFSGEILEWRKFKDTFISMVHEEQMPDIKKFHYLVSSLSGPAASVISRYQVEERNYSLAWKSLLEEFDSKRVLAAAYLNQILGFKPQSGKPSKESMNEFLIKITESVEAFRHLGITDESGFILFHLTVRCLDPLTREQFEIDNKGTEFPTFDMLSKFVRGRSQALQLAEGSNLNFAHPSDDKLKSSSTRSDLNKSLQKYRSKTALLTSDSQSCSICLEPRHALTRCHKFKTASLSDRLELIKNWKGCTNCLQTTHDLSSCRSKWVCTWCKQKHNSDICESFKDNSTVAPSLATTANAPPPKAISSHSSGSVCATTAGDLASSQVVLGTIIAEIQNSQGTFQPVRMVIDSASHYSFLTAKLLQKLGLNSENCKRRISGIGQTPFEGAKGQVNCIIRPRNKASPNLNTTAIVVKDITSHLPTTPLPYTLWRKYLNFELADPRFFESGPIEFLLGADLFSEIWTGASITVGENTPRLFPTVFGHVVTGKYNEPIQNSFGSSLLTVSTPDNILFDLQRFWEIEEPMTRECLSTPQNDECEAHFQATHYRKPDGSYVVRLPFKIPPPDLSDSSQMALHRFRNLEVKLEKNPKLKEEYSKFMRDYIDLGHMSPTSETPKYVIPHHCVVKVDRGKTKLRVVFDGSAKTSKGSLNDHLLTGPKLQNDIRNILINFRVHKYVFVTDIVKNFRGIWIDESDRPYQCIYWRFSPVEALQLYKLNTVTYGLSSSPYQSLAVTRQLNFDHGSEFPLARESLKRDIFVDDICTGADSLEQALELQQQIIKLMEKGNFSLSKWASNCPTLLERVSTPDNSSPISFTSDNEDGSSSLKILGLQWEPNQDYFFYEVHFPTSTKMTKRGTYSTISKLYDPLGLLSPFIIVLKMFIQEVWKTKAHWDDPITSELKEMWFRAVNQVEILSQIKIPRFIGASKPYDYQIIGFSDASENAYCACIYVRVIKGDFVKAQLLTAKTKVAPLQTLSLPRLELSAAWLLSRLYDSLDEFFKLMGNATYPPLFFTDSTITLSWLNTPPYKLKTFVANRVAEITNVIPPSSWNHVASHENPSDCGSRGLTPRELLDHDIWWNGPKWLSLPEESWPRFISATTTDLPELKAKSTLLNISPTIKTEEIPFLISLIQRYSRLCRLTRVIARILRLFNNAKSTNKPLSGNLSPIEIQNAMNVCIKAVQLHYFFKGDIKDPRDIMRQFKKLNPFFDNSGILRAGGRLYNANLPFNHKHPVLLPPDCHFSILIVDAYHKILLHPGPSLLQAVIQTRFWIPSLRRLTQQRTFKCVLCYKSKADSVIPLMSDLPAFRVQRSRAFLRVGMDFAGPFSVRESNRRKALVTKAYMCIIVCMATKAVHIEIVSSLSADAFLAAFDRFIARRGLPCEVHSDNGTNFVAASNRLKELWQWFKDENTQRKISDHTTTIGIKWIFNPPSSPHMGGIWEAAVKSAKRLIYKVASDMPMTLEEMGTLFCKVEAILNSRPLCPLSSDPSECEYLSPGHFLIGDSLISYPEPTLLDVKLSHLDRWQLFKKMTEYFWQRWHREYLSTLLSRSKWTEKAANPKTGDLVILKSDNVPVQRWPMARISDVHPGKDGVVRIVTVRTPTSSYTRPVAKIVPLVPVISNP